MKAIDEDAGLELTESEPPSATIRAAGRRVIRAGIWLTRNGYGRVALLDRLFRRNPTPSPDLSPDEEAYKVKTWHQVETLVGPALKYDPSDLSQIKDKALAEIDQHILHARAIGKTAQQLEDERVAELNRQIAARRVVLQNGYALTQEDFMTTLLPILAGISFVPDPEARAWSGKQISELLYSVSDSDYHTSKDAQDALMGLCDTMAVTHIAKALRTQYETLRKAAQAGVPLVRAYTDRHACEKCRALEGKELGVAMLLEAFASGRVAFPHELPSDECASWCDGPTLIAS